jgi:hypothetical protein
MQNQRLSDSDCLGFGRTTYYFTGTGAPEQGQDSASIHYSGRASAEASVHAWRRDLQTLRPFPIGFLQNLRALL